MKKEYKLNDEQLKEMLEACKPVPVVKIAGQWLPDTQMDVVNNLWQKFGKKMKFDWKTAQGLPEKGQAYFKAIPN